VNPHDVVLHEFTLLHVLIQKRNDKFQGPLLPPQDH